MKDTHIEQTPSLLLIGKTRANDVWHRLREDILSGVLNAGARLRFEQLKSTYGVSFATLREALSRLMAERLVIADAQKGFAVAPISVEEIKDITRVRVMVETEALRQSIANGGPAWRTSVMRAYHQLDRATVEGKTGSSGWAETHREFHRSLVEACDSPLLLDLCGRLFDGAHRYRRISMKNRVYNRDKSRQHRELMEAALTGNADGAVELIRDHIWETTNNVIASIESKTGESRNSEAVPESRRGPTPRAAESQGRKTHKASRRYRVANG
jgi:GntR family transcriptional regulator, carbon starvation induced regulator